MKHFNWTSYIKINLIFLKIVGLWPEQLYGLNSYTFFSVLSAILIIAGHNISQMINIFFVYRDLEALTGTIFVLTTNVLATVKMYLFVRNIKVVKELFRTLDAENFQPKSTQEIQLIEPSLRRWKICYTLFCLIVYTNVMLWCVSPFLNEGQTLPFVAWYPFDITVFPNYQLVYLYQVICICFITAANLNLDSLAYAILVYIWTQCDILCHKLEQLKGADFNYKLIKCIKHHHEIISFAKKSNHLFNLIILGQFFTSTGVLAMTMFQLSLAEAEEVSSNVFYLFGISAQLFFYCWFGNEVTVKSSHIPLALYKSNWLDQPVKYKKNMLLMSLMTKKPIKITAVRLFALSMHTFVTILRSAWSYFALLYNVNNR